MTEAKELSPEAKAALGAMTIGPFVPYASNSVMAGTLVQRLRDHALTGEGDAHATCGEAAEEIERLRHAVDIARTALLNIERRSEEGRAALTQLLSRG